MTDQRRRVFVCAIGENYSAIPYVNKLIGVLLAAGEKPVYAHWDRVSQGTPRADTLVQSETILRFASGGKFRLAIGYFLWVFKLFFFVFKNAQPSDLFLVSRVDTALPVFVVSMFRPVRYVYLDRDAAFMSYKAPKWILSLLKRLEGAVGRKALFHVVPGYSRNFTNADNVRVIPNSPSSVELGKAKDLALRSSLQKDARFIIYINGWLKPTRGAGFILETIKKIDPDYFRVLLAGELGCNEAVALSKLECVEYLGVVSNAEALSYYFKSDVVLCFYDPDIQINRVAEPNKWLDCVSTGVRFITNFGIETAAPYVEAGFCERVEYGDSEGLVAVLNEMRTRLNVQNSYGASNFDFVKPWNVAMGELLAET